MGCRNEGREPEAGNWRQEAGGKQSVTGNDGNDQNVGFFA